MSRNIITRTLSWLTGYSGEGPLLRVEGPPSRSKQVRSHAKHGKPCDLGPTPDGFSATPHDKATKSRNKAGSTGDMEAVPGDIHARSHDMAGKSDDMAPEADDMMAMSNDMARKSGDMTARSRDMIALSDDARRMSSDMLEKTGDTREESGDFSEKTDDISGKSRDLSIRWWSCFSWLSALWCLLWRRLDHWFYVRIGITNADMSRYFEETDFDDLFEVVYSEVADPRFSRYHLEVDRLERIIDGLIAYEVWLERYSRDRRLQLAFFLAYLQRLLRPLRRPAHQAQAWTVALARGIGSGPLFQRPPPVPFC